jgi:hypothetical protein
MMGMKAFCKLVCFYFGPPGLEVWNSEWNAALQQDRDQGTNWAPQRHTGKEKNFRKLHRTLLEEMLVANLT